MLPTCGSILPARSRMSNANSSFFHFLKQKPWHDAATAEHCKAAVVCYILANSISACQASRHEDQWSSALQTDPVATELQA